MSYTHLEVMISTCHPEEFAVIREFFEQRGYRLTESRHGTIFRLWADKPSPRMRPQGRPRLPETFHD